MCHRYCTYMLTRQRCDNCPCLVAWKLEASCDLDNCYRIHQIIYGVGNANATDGICTMCDISSRAVRNKVDTIASDYIRRVAIN